MRNKQRSAEEDIILYQLEIYDMRQLHGLLGLQNTTALVVVVYPFSLTSGVLFVLLKQAFNKEIFT